MALSGLWAGYSNHDRDAKNDSGYQGRCGTRFGGKVVLHGSNFDEAKAEAERLSAEHGFTFVPPFDHPLVIAGQGTMGMNSLCRMVTWIISLCRLVAVGPRWCCCTR